jgi:hypothetical protein
MEVNDFMKTRFTTFFAAFLFVGISQIFAAEGTNSRSVHPLEGSWRWNFTMPDGSTSRPKLVLAVEQDKLSGSIRFRPTTETRITNAALNGNQIRFQVVRQRDGRPIVTTYSGKWTDQVIKGTMESNWAGEKQSYDWEARRGHIGVEGTWRWEVSFGGGRPFSMRVDLEQDGEIVTGSMPGFRGGRKTEIKNGSFKAGEIYFETERGEEENKTVTVYRGKVIGDTIEGIRETTADGEVRESDWFAKRSD